MDLSGREDAAAVAKDTAVHGTLTSERSPDSDVRAYLLVPIISS
jgi:hypothetical protein